MAQVNVEVATLSIQSRKVDIYENKPRRLHAGNQAGKEVLSSLCSADAAMDYDAAMGQAMTLVPHLLAPDRCKAAGGGTLQAEKQNCTTAYKGTNPPGNDPEKTLLGAASRSQL